MEATKIEEFKGLTLLAFIPAIKDLKVEDLQEALGTRKTAELFALSEDTENLNVTQRYNIAKVIQQRMKKELIEPFKELRDKEEAEEQKKAAAKAEQRKAYAAEVDALFTEELQNSLLEIGRRYIEADLGTIVDIGLVVKRDPESKEIKVAYSSTLQKERTRGAATGQGAGRPRGSTGTTRGVTVQAGDKEKGAVIILEEGKHFNSFADAVRDLKPEGMPKDEKGWEGFNAKRFLISKGYVCEYDKTPEGEAPANGEQAAEGEGEQAANNQTEEQPVTQ